MSRKEEKVVIGINDQAIRKTKMEVANYLILLSMAKDSLKQLTENNVSDLDMDSVDNYLNSLTGFKNGSMSAMAYNLQGDYNELKKLIDEVNQGTHNLQFITKGKVDDAKIKESYTTYLRNEYTEEYFRLQEAISLLNESSMFIVRSSFGFGGDKVLFDVNRFQSAKVMSKR